MSSVGDDINPNIGGWTFGGNVAKTFDDHIQKSIPEYLEGHDLSDVSKLINGDIRETLPEFVQQQYPKKSSNHLYCRLVYIDCSAYEPAKLALDLLWDNVVPGRIIAIDQRTQGGEWKAGIEFCEERNIKPFASKDFNSAPIYIRKK